MLPHRKFKLSSLISIIYYNYFSQYGYPINQEDLAGTLSTFSSVVLSGLELLGVMATDSEKYGYQQLWKFVGYYLGWYQYLVYLIDIESTFYCRTSANGHLSTMATFFVPADKHPYIDSFNPSSPNSDQHLFSPNNIRTLSRDQVMRIIKMITYEKML